MLTVPVSFPPGEVLDVDGFVWVTLPAGTSLSGSRILGTCSIDPSALRLSQVTVERLSWRVDLISLGQVVPFPAGRAFEVAIVGLEQHERRGFEPGREAGDGSDVRAESTAVAPVKVTVHVRRTGGAERDSRGRLVRLPEPVTFQLTILARGEESS